MISMKILFSRLKTITTIIVALLGLILLLIGLSNLIHPEVSKSYIDQNTRICLILIVTGIIALFSVFRPFLGGILLCLCAVGLIIIFKGFLRNPITPIVLILGLITLFSSHPSVQRSSNNDA